MSLDIRLPILLRQLRLPTVAANYARFAQEAAQSSQRYEEYLLALLNEEVSQRDVNRRKRLVREARFISLTSLRLACISLILKNCSMFLSDLLRQAIRYWLLNTILKSLLLQIG